MDSRAVCDQDDALVLHLAELTVSERSIGSASEMNAANLALIRVPQRVTGLVSFRPEPQDGSICFHRVDKGHVSGVSPDIRQIIDGCKAQTTPVSR